MAGDLEALETRMDSGFKGIWDKLDALKDTVADLKAAIEHPDPEHCVQKKEIEVLKVKVSELEALVNRLKGAWSVVYWLIAGGVVNVAVLIYAFYTLGHSIAK